LPDSPGLCAACGVSAGAARSLNKPYPPRSFAMVVRFIEELIDVFNFGNKISK
jgi:hypothetical protein